MCRTLPPEGDGARDRHADRLHRPRNGPELAYTRSGTTRPATQAAKGLSLSHHRPGAPAVYDVNRRVDNPKIFAKGVEFTLMADLGVRRRAIDEGDDAEAALEGIAGRRPHADVCLQPG